MYHGLLKGPRTLQTDLLERKEGATPALLDTEHLSRDSFAQLLANAVALPQLMQHHLILATLVLCQEGLVVDDARYVCRNETKASIYTIERPHRPEHDGNGNSSPAATDGKAFL